METIDVIIFSIFIIGFILCLFAIRYFEKNDKKKNDNNKKNINILWKN